jgi:hypothetical protein
LTKQLQIDQKSDWRTLRSNSATYTEVLPKYVMLFYKDPESMIRGYKAGFSFNVKGGDAKPKLRIRSANNWVRTLFYLDVYVDAKLAKENDSIGET